MSLSIQERLKDLRVERGLTLGQLAEQTGLSKSALGSYETEDFKDISHYALIRLAKFYGVTADYLLEDEFCRYVIQRDINGIALALRETHKDDFFSVPEDNPLKEMLETAGEIVSQDSDTEQAYLAFICKRLKLNFRKLSVEERKWLKKIAEKSDLLKNPKPQRGRR